MQVTEPMTLITDYALAALSVVLGLYLLRAELRERISVQLWAACFLVTAFGGISGGTYHGLGSLLGDGTKALLWKVTMCSIGLASFFMLAGTVVASISRPWRRWLLAAILLKLVLYTSWALRDDSFRSAIYDYGSAMVGVLLLQGLAIYRGEIERAGWLIAGVIVSFAAAGVQQSGLTLHQHFNYNDLYHLIQMGALYLLYRGARVLKDED